MHSWTLLNIDEAAQMLGVGRSWLYYRVKAGELTPVKMGKRTLFPVGTIEAYIRRKAEESGAELPDLERGTAESEVTLTHRG